MQIAIHITTNLIACYFSLAPVHTAKIWRHSVVNFFA